MKFCILSIKTQTAKMNIIKAILFALLSIGLSFQLAAQQFSQNYWHSGEVHLKGENSAPVIGDLQYKLESDQIQLVVGNNRVKTFHASQISYVKFTDKLEGRLRHFFALPITDKQGYTRYQLFELLIEGEVSLLSRERIATRTQQTLDPFRPYGSNFTTQVLEDDFYLADNEGKIRQVSRRKNQPAWQAFPDMRKEMKTYFENEKIDVLYREEMFKMVSHYNTLKSGK